MGKIVRCRECGKVYRDVEELEDLRDNDSVCLVCNSTIEVADWDRVLASYEDDEDDGDVDDDDWDDEDDIEADGDEDDDDLGDDDDFEDLDDDDDEGDDDDDERD
jgi:hypothetical protein